MRKIVVDALFISALFVLWFGAPLFSAWRARRATEKLRRRYVIAAILSLFPFFMTEFFFGVEALLNYDGMCRHAPDLHYACSQFRFVVEAITPSSSFALFAFLMLGAFAFVFGVVCVAFAGFVKKHAKSAENIKA